jgi:uncharacterized protein YkwD
MKSILLILLLVSSCGISSDNTSSPEVIIEPVCKAASCNTERPVRELTSFINSHRANLGLGQILAVFALSQSAEVHAQNMSDGRYPLGHFGLAERCMMSRRALGGGNACSEIVAAGQMNSEAALRTWMNSWGHRRIIEDPRFTRMGLGVSVSRSGRPYWTVIFLQY